ncbi:lysine N(6)-hydroxylase/L-ornithine N(5)-oxygenase family protein [Azomonas macrocytogenes]|uniref:L-ornithine N5-oxygenase n=1 Tax=Azomonas macrocytogenes TaxID=69962 RepID=A0A839T629_AZOMA|nr:SidA/IucD/PvdA family monooxygenase [Azomonas macrocytogenes]MBB3104558.1 L-ornithine N5-oxygenase [Azomonas macrocytogenes]
MNQAIKLSEIHDLIGIGFGPSNIALAIALEEMSSKYGSLKTLYLDKQKNYSWHGNTLSTQSELQISFLKDLVSLRNPTSRYSFVNYLHEHGRLIDFINLGTFYPCRMEFNDYLRWVASHFSSQCRYGEQVIGIEPQKNGQQVETLRVISHDSEGQEIVRSTRSLVVSVGGTPIIPELFEGLRGDSRVSHHSHYLQWISMQPCIAGKAMRIAIIGGGQSAAEAFIDLNDSFPNVQVDMILRGSALKPADDSPFVNEIFSPAFTDVMFHQSEADRQRLLEEYHNTNYSVVDIDLIERIYGIFYRQKVSGNQRHAFRCLRQIEKVDANPNDIALTLCNTTNGDIETHYYDAVILATGYERQEHHQLLAQLQEYLGDFRISRNYRLLADERLKPAIFMQGVCQSSHGLSDTLLSVLPVRAEEIASSIHEVIGKTSVVEVEHLESVN